MKMEIKTVGAGLIAFLAVMLVLMSTLPVILANPNDKTTAGLRLQAIPGTYVWASDDEWLNESWVTTATSFDLNITNYNSDDIHFLYLLVAVDRVPAGNVTVNISGNIVGPYNGEILGNGKALVENTTPHFEYPGIYANKSIDTHFAVVNITSSIPGGILVRYENMTVPVEIKPLTGAVRVHIDVVGANNTHYPISWVPPSEDVTYIVPEFTTIAIPVASILGLLFFFNYRKRRKTK